MENAYGIGVRNRYELFYDDEEDPIDTMKKKEAARERKKELRLEKENKAKQAQAAKSIKQQQQQQQQQPVPPPEPQAQPQPPVQQTEEKPNKITGPKENAAKTSDAPKKEGPVPTSPPAGDGNNKAKGPRPPVEKSVKFNNVTVARDEPKDTEERKNRRNREDRGPPPNDFRDKGEQRETKEFREPREPREFREPREPREFRGEPRGDGDARRGRGGTGYRGSFRGGFRGRGRGGPGGSSFGGFDNRSKREFDRQSGSDRSVRHFDKREGGGSHNWGNMKESIDDQANTTLGDDQQDTSQRMEENVENVPPKEKVESAEPGPEKVVTDEPKEMTLDEWKKLQGKRSAPQYNIRKPGEGEDVSQWNQTYALNRKEKPTVAEEPKEEPAQEHESEPPIERKNPGGGGGRVKQLVDIEINFNDSRRSRGGRGMGRGGRGGRGRGTFNNGDFPARGPPQFNSPYNSGSGYATYASGGYRGKAQSAPRVDDEKDFPSLVTA